MMAMANNRNGEAREKRTSASACFRNEPKIYDWIDHVCIVMALDPKCYCYLDCISGRIQVLLNEEN